jgi:hypothetical protein
MINKELLIPFIIILTFGLIMVTAIEIYKAYGDLLPPIGQWTNCRNLPEVCDFPQWEAHNLSDIVIYRFENGSMIGQYVGDSPIDK